MDRNSKSEAEPKISYTEDNVIVRAIYVSNLAKCPFPVTDKSLKNYFARAGAIEEFTFIRKFDTKFALITFKNAEDAYKVLNDKRYKTKMTVRKADSWHQPKSSVPIVSNSDDEYVLLRLNDDCLYHVLSFLNPFDLVNVAQTNHRVSTVARWHLKKYSTFDCDTVDIDHKRSKQEIYYTFQFVGPSITQLSFSSGCFNLSDEKIMSIFTKFCCKVETLTMKDVSSFDLNSLCKQFFASIKKLTIRYCKINDKTLMKLLRPDMSQLEHLEVIGCYNLNGKFLQKLPKIKSVTFDSCWGLMEPDFNKGLDNNSSLKELKNVCGKLKLDELRVSNLKDLEKLEADLPDYFATFMLDKLLSLERLTKLIFKAVKDVNIDHFLNQLGKKNILEELSINRLIITDDTMIAFESFTKLKALNLDAPVTRIGKFSFRLQMVLPGLKSFVCTNGNLTLHNYFTIIKSLKQLEFIDISEHFYYRNEAINKIFEYIKIESERPLLRVAMNSVGYFQEDIRFEKIPFFFEGRCVLELSMKYDQYSINRRLPPDDIWESESYIEESESESEIVENVESGSDYGNNSESESYIREAECEPDQNFEKSSDYADSHSFGLFYE